MLLLVGRGGRGGGSKKPHQKDDVINAQPLTSMITIFNKNWFFNVKLLLKSTLSFALALDNFCGGSCCCCCCSCCDCTKVKPTPRLALGLNNTDVPRKSVKNFKRDGEGDVKYNGQWAKIS